MAKREPKTPGEQSFHAWWSAFKEAGKGGPDWAIDGDFDTGWAEEPDKELWERAAVETVRAFLRRAYEEALAPSLDGHVFAQRHAAVGRTSLNEAALTAAHVALCQVEEEMRLAGRTVSADAIAYADLVVLAARESLHRAERANTHRLEPPR